MAQEMPRRHRNLFHTMTRAQFDAAVAALDERIPSLERHQIIVEMARIAAMVGDGHTNVAPTRGPEDRVSHVSGPPLSLPGRPLRARGRRCPRRSRRRACAPHRQRLGRRGLRRGREARRPRQRDGRPVLRSPAPLDARSPARARPGRRHGEGLLHRRDGTDGSRVVVLSPAGPADLLPPDTDTSWMRKDGWIDARGDRRPALAARSEEQVLVRIPAGVACPLRPVQPGRQQGRRDHRGVLEAPLGVHRQQRRSTASSSICGSTGAATAASTVR